MGRRHASALLFALALASCSERAPLNAKFVDVVDDPYGYAIVFDYRSWQRMHEWPGLTSEQIEQKIDFELGIMARAGLQKKHICDGLPWHFTGTSHMDKNVVVLMECGEGQGVAVPDAKLYLVKRSHSL